MRGEFLAPKSNVRYVPLTRDDTQHEKCMTLIRQENIKFEYKYFKKSNKCLTYNVFKIQLFSFFYFNI